MRMKTDEGLEKALWREADCQAHSYATTMEEGLDSILEEEANIFMTDTTVLLW